MPTIPSATVLLAGPDRSTLLDLAERLGGSGFDVLLARSQDRLPAHVRSAVCGAAVVEMASDGAQAAAEVRRLSALNPGVALIVLREKLSSEAVVRFLRSGAVACMEKPCHYPELEARLRHLLRPRAARP